MHNPPERRNRSRPFACVGCGEGLRLRDVSAVVPGGPICRTCSMGRMLDSPDLRGYHPEDFPECSRCGEPQFSLYVDPEFPEASVCRWCLDEHHPDRTKVTVAYQFPQGIDRERSVRWGPRTD